MTGAANRSHGPLTGTGGLTEDSLNRPRDVGADLAPSP